MPVYEYHCEANGRTVDVSHPLDAVIGTWLEVCYVARIPLGDTDPMALVRRVMTRAPGIAVMKGNAELRDLGFAKLVRREDGVYENVTAAPGAPRIVRGTED